MWEKQNNGINCLYSRSARSSSPGCGNDTKIAFLRASLSEHRGASFVERPARSYLPVSVSDLLNIHTYIYIYDVVGMPDSLLAAFFIFGFPRFVTS